jgi:hypothetical protein|tara:strand:+ start:351 stop:608 length:258 start_codon:yes stop_codon:yes gene_type:complete
MFILAFILNGYLWVSMGEHGRMFPHPTFIEPETGDFFVAKKSVFNVNPKLCKFCWSIVVTYDDQVTNAAMRVMIYYIVCGDTNTV